MKTLVIGYGNTLRGDDSVGPLVAEQVTALNLPDVQSLAVHQLTPELVVEIAQAETVFFIDAWQVVHPQGSPKLGDLGFDVSAQPNVGKCKAVATFPTSSQPSIERLFPSISSTSILDHNWSPSILLYLANILYNANPVAYRILIPAIQFDYGKTLSAIASDGLTWSIKALKNYLASPQSTHREELPCMKSA